MLNKSILLATVLTVGAAQAQAPLSAIDWLDTTPGEVATAPAPIMVEPPVATTATVPRIAVAPLDAVSVSSVGLLPPRVTGLPTSIWRQSNARTLGAVLKGLDVSAHPALTSLLYTLLLAEAEAPLWSRSDAEFLIIRIEKLLEMGAVEPALALMERAGPEHPDLFGLWFELSLLSNRATEGCATLRRAPHLTQDASVRVFCTARLADWPTAVTILQTAAVLGDIDAARVDLLERFLDPELAEDSPNIAAPRAVDALIFRLYEAIGERLPTQTLPRRFLIVDLGGDAGWKAQLEAAERLARVGAISDNRLLGIFTDRRPSASGGIWNRVSAVQALDKAMQAQDAQPEDLRLAARTHWPVLRDAGLHTIIANLYGAEFAPLLADTQDPILAEIALLSPAYETAAEHLPGTLPDRDLLRAVALGLPYDATQRDPLKSAIASAFGPVSLPDRLQRYIDDQALGHGILTAMALFESGALGNPTDLRDGLMGLRTLGLEDTARRAALHLLLVELQP